jgi:hypothetical protein
MLAVWRPRSQSGHGATDKGAGTVLTGGYDTISWHVARID